MRLSLPKLSLSDMTIPWVHASVPAGCDAIKDHARFILQNLVIGVIGLSLIPVVLALKEGATALDFVVFTLLASPLALAALVSRTGSLELGKRVALFCVALLVGIVVGSSGGLTSPYALLLCILPFEAILWRCKAPIALAVGLLLAACGSVAVSGWIATVGASANFFTALDPFWLATAGIAYSGAIAVRLHSLIRSQDDRLARETRRVDIFTRHSGELITRHEPNGATLFASPAARDMVGVSGQELLETGLVGRVHIQDRVVLLKAISDAAQKGSEQTHQLRIRVSGSDGRLWKQVEIRCRPHKDVETGKSEAICAMRDVSALQDLQADLLEAREAAEALEESQRRFLATMSHELRTPLNAIVGFSDILKQELFGPMGHDKHREYVGLIQESGRHLLNVVNDMLDMSRIEAGKYELMIDAFSFAEIANSTKAMLHPLAHKGGVTVNASIDPTLPEIRADKRACQQILINLLSNAIKFTPEGGSVQLSAKQFGRSLRVRIKDDGIGIDEDFLSTIGQPFTQADNGTNRRFEGSGIGLSVVKGLVALHGGDFSIKSKLGAGTVVTVMLPLAATASKPVPTDTDQQLVHLNRAAKSSSLEPSAVTMSKGDRHARVSA